MPGPFSSPPAMDALSVSTMMRPGLMPCASMSAISAYASSVPVPRFTALLIR